VPLPSDGSTVDCPLLPALSTVRSPYGELGPLTQIVPAPPSFPCDDVPLADAVVGTVLVASVYSTAIAPPPPAPYVRFALPTSIRPAPLILPVLIHTEPPAPERSEFDPPPMPLALIVPSTITAPPGA